MNSQDLIKILEQKLQAAPGDLQTKEKLASLLYKQAKYQRAEKLWEEILSIHIENKEALWGLIQISWVKKKHKKMYSLFARLMPLVNENLNKDQALLYAKACVQLKKFPEGQHWFDKAVSMDSSLLESEIGLLRYLRVNNYQAENRQDPDSEQEGNFVVMELDQVGQPIPGHSYTVDPHNINGVLENTVPAETHTSIITFDQIGGLNHTKRQLIKELIFPLTSGDITKSIAKTNNPKVLVYGASGIGKTLLCHALYHETEITFLSLGLADFADLSFEESEIKLEYLFAQARYSKPAIILIDEANWLFHSSDTTGTETSNYFYRKNLYERILKLLNDKFRFNSHIGLLCITSKPWDLSPDIFGSSKINKTLYIAPPTFAEKVDILNIILNKKKSPILNPEKIDTLEIIRAIDKYCLTGADIEYLVDETIANHVLDNMLPQVAEDKEYREINTRDILRTSRQCKDIGNSTKQWLKKAKQEMKSKKSPLNFLWKTMEETKKNNYA